MPLMTLRRTSAEPAQQAFDSSLTATQIDKMADKENEYRKENNQEVESTSGYDVATLNLTLNSLYQEATPEFILERILATLDGPKDWRSAWGLGQATGHFPEAISTVLEANPHLFEICPIKPAGIKFYRLKGN